jgi:hypothetical protein
MLVMTRLRRFFGMRALARFTKSRGSETLMTAYCPRPLGMSVPPIGYGLLLITIFHSYIAVNLKTAEQIGLTIHRTCWQGRTGWYDSKEQSAERKEQKAIGSAEE